MNALPTLYIKHEDCGATDEYGIHQADWALAEVRTDRGDWPDRLDSHEAAWEPRTNYRRLEPSKRLQTLIAKGGVIVEEPLSCCDGDVMADVHFDGQPSQATRKRIAPAGTKQWPEEESWGKSLLTEQEHAYCHAWLHLQSVSSE